MIGALHNAAHQHGLRVCCCCKRASTEGSECAYFDENVPTASSGTIAAL